MAPPVLARVSQVARPLEEVVASAAPGSCAAPRAKPAEAGVNLAYGNIMKHQYAVISCCDTCNICIYLYNIIVYLIVLCVHVGVC